MISKPVGLAARSQARKNNAKRNIRKFNKFAFQFFSVVTIAEGVKIIPWAMIESFNDVDQARLMAGPGGDEVDFMEVFEDFPGREKGSC